MIPATDQSTGVRGKNSRRPMAGIPTARSAALFSKRDDAMMLTDIADDNAEPMAQPDLSRLSAEELALFEKLLLKIAFVAMWRDRVETLYARYLAPTLRRRDTEMEQFATARTHTSFPTRCFVGKVYRQSWSPVSDAG
jgi:hypothetical protein